MKSVKSVKSGRSYSTRGLISFTNDLVQFEPSDYIVFKGPFDKNVKSTLIIENISDELVLFKIKSTKAFLFYMKPSQGSIKPGATLEMKVICKPVILDNIIQNKTKFLIEYAFYDNDGADLNKKAKKKTIEEFLNTDGTQKYLKIIRAFFETDDMLYENRKMQIRKSSKDDISEKTEVTEANALRMVIHQCIEENLEIKKRIVEIRKKMDFDYIKRQYKPTYSTDYVLLQLGGDNDPLIKISHRHFYTFIIIMFLSLSLGIIFGHYIWPLISSRIFSNE